MRSMTKKNDRARRKSRLRVILFALTLLFTAIVGTALLISLNSHSFDSFFESQLLDSVFVDVFFILMLLFPVILFVFAVDRLLHRMTVASKKGEAETESESLSHEETPPETADEEEEDDVVRFKHLTEIDEAMRGYRAPSAVRGLTLENFCERFRNFAASRKGLYYDRAVIRQFVAGLATSHTMIMQGMSGTGKTSLACAFGDFIKNTSSVVSVQPMWKDSTDMLGYYNEFTKRFSETVLLQKLYEALYSEEIYISVLDEMNIARIEYYFADFLSKLELNFGEECRLQIISRTKENDPVKLENGRLRLPENMWYIGTANNDDSTFAISDKVYDRAMVINLNSKAEPFEAPLTDPVRIPMSQWKKLVAEAKRKYSMTRRNHRRVAELDKFMTEKFKVTFGNRIRMQMATYVSVFIACGGEELDAIDDILTKKVLRKLESLNPLTVRNLAGQLKDKLNDLFGDGRMHACLDYLDYLLTMN